jgi:DNA-binding IclR family transcriptional regulator
MDGLRHQVTASRVTLEGRIRSEFQEMRGLSLTVQQAARLFGIPRETCVELLSGLTRVGFLEQKAGKRYGLRDGRP